MGNYQKLQETIMTLVITTITNSIAALSITGLTIKDIDEIPQGVLDRDCPILTPNPDNFVTKFKVEPDTLDKSKWTVSYELNYLLLYAVVGSGRTTSMEKFSGMVSKAFSFIDAVAAAMALTGAVDWSPGVIDGFDIVTIGQNNFHSCHVNILIWEFIN
jgi:hypothetical protein